MKIKWLMKRIGTTLYNNRSNIEFVVGTGCVIAGTAMIATKAEDAVKVKNDVAREKERIAIMDEQDGWDSPSQRTKACAHMVKTGVKGYAKAYGPGVAVETAGIVLQTISKVTDNKQIAIQTGIATALASQFNSYRQAVIEDQGEEKDEQYLLGTVKEVEAHEDGTTTEKIVPTRTASHTIMFDESNDNWDKRDFVNKEFLEDHLFWLNERLWKEGVLFENDIRRDIGAPIDPSACTFGITAVNDNGDRQYLSFGMEKNTERAQAFRDGSERSFLITLNVEPNVNTKLYRLNKYQSEDIRSTHN
jgi:hypothetical protein